jgi:hypothetical protein
LIQRRKQKAEQINKFMDYTRASKKFADADVKSKETAI